MKIVLCCKELVDSKRESPPIAEFTKQHQNYKNRPEPSALEFQQKSVKEKDEEQFVASTKVKEKEVDSRRLPFEGLLTNGH